MLRLDALFHSNYAALSGRVKSAPANRIPDIHSTEHIMPPENVEGRGHGKEGSEGSLEGPLAAKATTDTLRPEAIKDISEVRRKAYSERSLGLKVAEWSGFVNMDDDRR